MKNMKKRGSVALIVCLMLAVCLISISGTIAWLTDKTTTVTNTFTESDVDIDLAETTGPSYKMVPGQAIFKNPKVTVKKDSEACWVFVKIEKKNSFDNFMSYKVDDAWSVLDADEHHGVYYMKANDTDEDQVFSILFGDTVTVKSDVTKAMMDGLNDSNYPTLTFTAYAIQKAGFGTAADAWLELNRSSATP